MKTKTDAGGEQQQMKAYSLRPERKGGRRHPASVRGCKNAHVRWGIGRARPIPQLPRPRLDHPGPTEGVVEESPSKLDTTPLKVVLDSPKPLHFTSSLASGCTTHLPHLPTGGQFSRALHQMKPPYWSTEAATTPPMPTSNVGQCDRMSSRVF